LPIICDRCGETMLPSELSINTDNTPRIILCDPDNTPAITCPACKNAFKSFWFGPRRNYHSKEENHDLDGKILRLLYLSDVGLHHSDIAIELFPDNGASPNSAEYKWVGSRIQAMRTKHLITDEDPEKGTNKTYVLTASGSRAVKIAHPDLVRTINPTTEDNSGGIFQ